MPANEDDDDDEDVDDENTPSTSEGEKFSGSDTESDENELIKNTKSENDLIRIAIYGQNYQIIHSFNLKH